MPAKNQTPPVLSPAREMLQQSLEAQDRARKIVDKAEKVVAAAQAAVEEARASASRYDEAAEDIVRSRLLKLKGEEPAKSADEIRESRRSRHIAKEELLEADQVLEAAKQELETAHGNIARGQKVGASHATSVLSESVTDVIAEWDRLNLERERLRAILAALVVTPGLALDALSAQQQELAIKSVVETARLPYGDFRDWGHLQNKAGAALSRNFAQPDPGPGIARSRAYWASFADALLADPAAEQAPLPSAAELFG